MLETRARLSPTGWVEWIIGAIDEPVERKRREALVCAQHVDRLRFADAEVDTEVDVAGVDAIDLIPVRQADRRALADLVRERDGAAVAAIDENPRCRPPVRESTEPCLILRTMQKRRLAQIRARRPRRLQILAGACARKN